MRIYCRKRDGKWRVVGIITIAGGKFPWAIAQTDTFADAIEAMHEVWRMRPHHG